ncbi:MAG: hypothetical protein ACR2PT_18360 [Endozoicomonas sp.]
MSGLLVRPAEKLSKEQQKKFVDHVESLLVTTKREQTVPRIESLADYMKDKQYQLSSLMEAADKDDSSFRTRSVVADFNKPQLSAELGVARVEVMARLERWLEYKPSLREQSVRDALEELQSLALVQEIPDELEDLYETAGEAFALLYLKLQGYLTEESKGSRAFSDFSKTALDYWYSNPISELQKTLPKCFAVWQSISFGSALLPPLR